MLFNEMIEANRRKDVLKLQYLIAKMEAEAATANYKAASGKEIYCGDEDRAEFLISALDTLGLNTECEVFTVDGEYFVEVKL